MTGDGEHSTANIQGPPGDRSCHSTVGSTDNFPSGEDSALGVGDGSAAAVTSGLSLAEDWTGLEPVAGFSVGPVAVSSGHTTCWTVHCCQCHDSARNDTVEHGC